MKWHRISLSFKMRLREEFEIVERVAKFFLFSKVLGKKV